MVELLREGSAINGATPSSYISKLMNIFDLAFLKVNRYVIYSNIALLFNVLLLMPITRLPSTATSRRTKCTSMMPQARTQEANPEPPPWIVVAVYT